MMNAYKACVLVLVTSCATTKFPHDTGDSAAGQPGMDGGAGGALAHGGTGAGGAVACEIPMDGPCPAGCCPLMGALYEVPNDRSCRREIARGTVGCFEQALAGCGGSGLLNCEIERPTEDGWEVIVAPGDPYGWSPRDGWSICDHTEQSAVAVAGPDCP